MAGGSISVWCRPGLSPNMKPKMELVLKVWLLNANTKGMFFVNGLFRP